LSHLHAQRLRRRHREGLGLALTLVAFAALSLGGWLGGALVFRHGMRVEEDAAESTQDAGVTHRTRTHGA
jgi:uncharacterized membrane protein